MDLIPAVINAAIVMLVGVVITYLTRTQFQDLRAELKDDIAELRTEVRSEATWVRGEIGALRGEIGALRSDLTQLAIALGTRPRPQTG